MTERIGSDVLNAAERAQQQMQEKKKKEMMQKLAEEKSKRMSDELDGKKIPSEGVPGNHAHERKCGEGADLDIHSRQVRVRAHNRGSPHKKKE